MIVPVVPGPTNRKRVKSYPGIEVGRKVPADIIKAQDINERAAVPVIRCLAHLKLFIWCIDKYFVSNVVHNLYIPVYFNEYILFNTYFVTNE